MNKRKVLDKVVSLMYAKSKTFTTAQLSCWVDLLTDNFREEDIVYAIDKFIWINDDFPTLAKIKDLIFDKLRLEAIAEHTIEDTKLGISLEKYIKAYIEKNTSQKNIKVLAR